MKQIQIFPFSRDGYHYDVQPGYLPVFEVGPGANSHLRVVSPQDFGGIIVEGSDMAQCESRMQDMLHDLLSTLAKADSLLLLNRKGESILQFYRKHINFTKP